MLGVAPPTVTAIGAPSLRVAATCCPCHDSTRYCSTTVSAVTSGPVPLAINVVLVAVGCGAVDGKVTVGAPSSGPDTWGLVAGWVCWTALGSAPADLLYDEMTST